jgi:membrane-bound metal-dependent hydrolase YbcI (DUF457 family)
MGGREQFAHARGFTVSFYGGLLIEALVILLYPGIRPHLIVIFYDGITIALIASLLAAVTCRILAKIIFRKMQIHLQMP